MGLGRRANQAQLTSRFARRCTGHGGSKPRARRAASISGFEGCSHAPQAAMISLDSQTD
jgi:hypothetical protein